MRAGEQKNTSFQTDRFFSVNASWYFATREGSSIGPFSTKFEAQEGLSNFIYFVQKAEPSVLNSFLGILRNEL
jgi:hypothetical protein